MPGVPSMSSLHVYVHISLPLAKEDTVQETSVGCLMVHVYSKKECQKHTEKDFKDIQSSSTLTKYEHKWVMRRVALTNYLNARGVIAHRVCFLFCLFHIHSAQQSQMGASQGTSHVPFISFFLTNRLFQCCLLINYNVPRTFSPCFLKSIRRNIPFNLLK